VVETAGEGASDRDFDHAGGDGQWHSELSPHCQTFPYCIGDVHLGLGFRLALADTAGDRRALGDIHAVFVLIDADRDLYAAVILPFIKYSLTSIYSMGYIESVESIFEVIAEPNRRAILSLLAVSEQSVGEIERQLDVPQPTVSKHLRVLRDAGFVESTVDAQRRVYRLRLEPLREIDAWLEQFRRFWSAHLDALERHLDRMDRIKADEKKSKVKTPRPKSRN
jgi:DNA-binding transcriptional ArsR family regulator